MDRRLGVLAFGDSITNGGGELQWGVALQSWALWTARGLGLPYTGCAARRRDRARRRGPADPRLRRHRRRPGGALRRRPAPHRRQRRPRRRAGTRRPTSATSARRSRFLRQRCSRVARLHDPARPRPPAGAARSGSRRRTRRSSGSRACCVCDLRDFGARNRVMVDAVHPDGVRAGRDRGARAGGARPRRAARRACSRPRSSTGRRRAWKRLRGDATYAYRQAKQAARNAYRRARARRAG